MLKLYEIIGRLDDNEREKYQIGMIFSNVTLKDHFLMGQMPWSNLGKNGENYY
jgi:hypothetical protein